MDVWEKRQKKSSVTEEKEEWMDGWMDGRIMIGMCEEINEWEEKNEIGNKMDGWMDRMWNRN